MTKSNRDKLTLQFKKLVHDKAEEVDPSGEHDWYSITLGFGLACGLTPQDAEAFATYIRYNTKLG